MAIAINDHPGEYYSAHGDLLFVVYEATKSNDPINYPDYKYVADVYIDSVMVARVKKWPQPDSKRGIFNIGSIVRNYLTTIFNPAGAFLAQQLGEEEFFSRVVVKFGEEYDGTLYTNLTVDDERYYFNHYNGKLIGSRTALTSKVGEVITNRPYFNKVMYSGSRSFLTYLPDSNSDFPVEIKTYNSVLIRTENSTYPSNNHGATISLPWSLSQGVGVDVDLRIYKNNVLIASSDITASGTFNAIVGDIIKVQCRTDGSLNPWTGGGTPYAFTRVTEDAIVIYYNQVTSQGAANEHLLSEAIFSVKDKDYDIDIVSFNGTVPGTSNVDNTNTTLTLPYDINVFDVSPSGINSEFPGLINSFVEYYTVKFGGTSIFRFDLVCDPRYENHTLHFLNQYGGFESRDFSKVSRKSIEIDKKSFGKLPYTVSDAGAIQYSNSNNVYNEQQSTYSSQFKESLILNTDILSDDEYTWLGDLIISPMVYLEQDGYFLPVTIKANNYDYKKQVNDKLTNLTIELEFGETFNAQYR